jgi:hypothetical protein
MLREDGAQAAGTIRAHESGGRIQYGSERLIPQDHLQNCASFAFKQTFAFDYPSLLDQSRCKSRLAPPVTEFRDPIPPGNTQDREQAEPQFRRCPGIQAVNEPVRKQVSLMPLM